jgi:hypothetical protein
MSKADLKGTFKGTQDVLAAALRSARGAPPHNVAKGDATEENWKDLLRNFLPRRYGVDRAFVVDSSGASSDQIDLVVYDCHYSMLLYNQAKCIIVPAESVFAVFEVKQELDKENMVYAADKIASVRELKRTSTVIPALASNAPKKEPEMIIGGILTSRSSWSPPFGDAFDAVVGNSTGNKRLQLGCALEHGSFSVAHDGTIERSDAEGSLVFFAFRLLAALQRMGNPPAIDFARYADLILKAGGT